VPKELTAAGMREILDHSQNIVFFGGAGVSTESGIPDFRSADGLYQNKDVIPPETILSHSFFMRNPAEFFVFYREKMINQNAKPNPCHLLLAKWERQGKIQVVITQNIDHLHQMAGSLHVLELHGSVYRNRCMKCGNEFGIEAILASTGIPKCACGGIIKPAVVLYEEALDSLILDQSVSCIQNAEVLIVGGTSLSVYPAAGLLQYYRGNHLILINKDHGPFDQKADYVYYGKIGNFFKEVDQLEK
jgi:NAD-dependent deacetylase